MDRRSLLAAVAAISTSASGCLSRSATTVSRSPTPTPSPTSTPSPGCPEKPSPLTEDAVGAFAYQFERAWLERVARALKDRVVNVSHDFGLAVDSVTVLDSGFEVALNGGFAIFYDTGTGTAHYDATDYRARYFVTAETVRRSDGWETAPDPRSTGRAVTCPPTNPPSTIPPNGE